MGGVYPDPAFNDTVTMIDYADGLIDGWLTPLFMLACFVVAFIFLKRNAYTTADSSLVACFITFVLGSFLWAASLLPGKILTIWLLLLVASGLWSVFSE